MGNMDPHHTDDKRPKLPTDEDDDEDVNQEQLRLVETPDSVVFSVMGGGRSTFHAGDGAHCDKPFLKTKDSTSIQCQNEFYSNYINESPVSELTTRALKKIKSKKCTPVKWIVALIPILSWLPEYNWKTDLAYDATAGFTVAVMNIPQGMAYALLSNVEPIAGLYMGFFPVLVYACLGTSRHISIGTFAVICMMSGKVISEKSAYYAEKSANATLDTTSFEPYSPTEISITLSLCVGVWQIIMGIFQLGSLSVLLSTELISGFTTGCAIHVLTSQLKNLFGLKTQRRTGIFKIPLTYSDVVMGVSKEANTTSVLLSVVTIAFLLTYNELIKPTLSKRLSFPIPIELITIIIGTVVSNYWITSAKYGISVVDKIPKGLPNPVVPPMSIVPDLVIDSLTIAVVAYAISISMAKIFAHKHHYEVRPNQELIANGTGNLLGSFFSCAPNSASLSRSMIQEQVGGRTQVAGIISSAILLFVLLWLAPFFETLPHCVLSSLIVVALKGMFMQLGDFPKAWKESRINGVIWLVSFLATVFLDIEYGLLIGVIITLSSLLWKTNSFAVIEIGQHVHTHLLVEKNKPDTAICEVPNTKILKLVGNLNFVTCHTFTSKVNSILNRSHMYLQRHTMEKEATMDNKFFTSMLNSSMTCTVSTLIFDFSSVSSIDPAAVKGLIELHSNHSNNEVQIFYTGCPNEVIGVMHQCNLFKDIPIQSFYPSVENVVLHLRDIESIRDVENERQTLVDTHIADNFNEYYLGG